MRLNAGGAQALLDPPARAAPTESASTDGTAFAPLRARYIRSLEARVIRVLCSPTFSFEAEPGEQLVCPPQIHISPTD